MSNGQSNNSQNAPPPPLRLSWFIWGLGALFYLMGFFHRVAPAVMTTELMREFQISAAALGNLSGYYFYSYVAMQIPTGILADTLGPRRLLSAGAMVASVGTLLFALAPNLAWASIGRLLIGGSVAVAFVGMLKLSNCWFPQRFYAMASGMALLCGIIGAVFAGTPLRLLINIYGWRSVITASALVTFGICIAIWVFIRDNPCQKGYADHTACAMGGGSRLVSMSVVKGILKVFRYRNTLLLFVIPGAIVGSVLTFSGLWGVPYLTTHYGLSASKAAMVTSAVLVAWALGGPLFGWFSDRWGYRKPLYIAGCALTLLGWAAALYIENLPLSMRIAALLIAGFNSGAMIISFAFAKESVPGHLAGTISGVINMGVMMGPMVLQPAVGWMLDVQWQGRMQGGVKIYGLHAYQAGFSMMLAWVALALVLLCFTRETRCKQIA
ncbi:MAG: MFS transporter [Desulfobacteraceae bacterium]